MDRENLIKQFYKYVSRNIAGMMGVSVYILADTYFISVTAGADGITLLNLALPLYGLIYAIGAMIGFGSATRYAINKAKGDEAVSEYFTHALLWQILLALPFVMLGIFSPQTWITIMGGDAGIVALGRPYVKIVLIGAPFFMMNYSFTAFARNDHAPTIAMLAAVLASAFNIVFDYIFIFPCNMGITGAALATAMSPVVSSLICCIHFFSKKSTIKIKTTKVSVHLLVSCAQLGVSAFVGEISSAVTTVVFNFLLLNIAGNIGVAAYGIVANLAIVAVAIFNGVAQGMQPQLSQFFGEGKTKDMRKFLKIGIVVTICLELIMVCVSWIFTKELVGFFNSEGNKLLADYAFDALRLYFLGFLIAGLNTVLISYYASIGEARKASIASIIRGAIAIVVCAIALGKLFGMNGIWLSFLASELVVGTVLLPRFSRH